MARAFSPQYAVEYVLGARLCWVQGHNGERAGPPLRSSDDFTPALGAPSHLASSQLCPSHSLLLYFRFTSTCIAATAT